jgi:2-phosphoglycolate phosphatase
VAGIPPFRAYLFDVDGTLLDSAPDICGAVSSVLAGTTKPDVPHEYLRTFIGRHLIDLFGELFPEAPAGQVEAWIQQYRETYLSRGHVNTKLYPAVAETLALLGGLKTTATTKGTTTATMVLRQFGLIDHFDHVQGTDGFPSKPEPEVLRRAMEALGVRPQECLMIGDSVPDIVAARAAGVKVCAVSYGYGDPEHLRAQEPDYWIDSFGELAPAGG